MFVFLCPQPAWPTPNPAAPSPFTSSIPGACRCFWSLANSEESKRADLDLEDREIILSSHERQPATNDSEMDHESLMLAIKLQFEDLELCERSKKGKEREGEVLDADVALGACRHELEQMAKFASDQALCLSIVKAVDLDATLIAEVQAEEEQAARDHEFALRLSRDPNAVPPATGTTEKPAKDVKDTLVKKFKSTGHFALGGSDGGLNQAESSRFGASRKHPDSEECVACTERFATSSLTRSPCSHNYCRECIVNLVTSSLHDASLFPPRCCGKDIPIKAGPWFSPDLMGQFRAKKLEFDTPNRTYCSDPSCSTFVPPAFVKGEMAHCPKCRRRTCVHCKEPSHEGVYPSDSASQQVLDLAKQNGWQQCKACKRVVELNTGCNHISEFPPRLFRLLLIHGFHTDVDISLCVSCSVLLRLWQDMEDLRLPTMARTSPSQQSECNCRPRHHPGRHHRESPRASR